jgi:hypothetical protein
LAIEVIITFSVSVIMPPSALDRLGKLVTRRNMHMLDIYFVSVINLGMLSL